MELFESVNVEFKREYTVDIRKEVIAFANSQGGTIYIGIGDDGEVIGLSDTDSVLLRVTSMIRDAIKPDVSIFTDVKIEKRNENSVVVVEVQRGTDRPYYIADKGLKPSGVYVRSGSASVPASDDFIRRMIKETDGETFETTRSLDQDLTFDFTKKEFAARNLDFGTIQMRTLGIIGEDSLFTNLGLLLSDQCSHTIKVAVFQGNDKSVFKDRREFDGSLLEQLVNVYEYIDLHNRTRSTIKGLLRVDKRDYSEIAIREMLLNAIVHREYSFSASTLISIFDNRIEVVSLGGLVPGLSLEAIKIGASQSRNMRLANIFYRLKLIEAYGTGIGKMIESYVGLTVQPDFITADGAFLTVLPNMNEQNKVSHKAPIMNLNMQKVLEYMKTHEDVSRKEIQELLGIGQTAAGNLLHEMKDNGFIQSIGRGKHTRYSSMFSNS